VCVRVFKSVCVCVCPQRWQYLKYVTFVGTFFDPHEENSL